MTFTHAITEAQLLLLTTILADDRELCESLGKPWTLDAAKLSCALEYVNVRIDKV
jgi:hypothetical protein